MIGIEHWCRAQAEVKLTGGKGYVTSDVIFVCTVPGENNGGDNAISYFDYSSITFPIRSLIIIPN